MRRPRPAWYHATATCTRPWKKSRSSAGAARHASSSSSCAAKYSPRRINSTPALYADSNFSVFDLDVVGLQLDGEVELVLAGAYVVLPSVPGAREDAAFEAALAERALEVEAVRLHRVEASIAVRERNLLVPGPHRPDSARRDVLDPRHGDEIHAATLATAPRITIRSRGGHDPVVWGRCLLSGQARGPADRSSPGHDR